MRTRHLHLKILLWLLLAAACHLDDARGDTVRCGNDFSGLIVILVVSSVVAIGGGVATEVTRRSGIKVARTISDHQRDQLSKKQSRAIAKILERDPDFNLDDLAARFRDCFLKVTKARADGDAESVRHFVSDGIYERMAIQARIAAALDQKTTLEDVEVVGIRHAAVESDKVYDAVHFAITAATSLRVEDAESGRCLVPPSRKTSTEYWSFLRKPGVRTFKQPGAMEGSCPNCGASVVVSDAGVCESCKAFLNSGEYDWVLSEITRDGEWEIPSDETNVPGVSDMLREDPAFNVQHLEDRCSVMFWRFHAAQFFKNPAYLRKMATPEFILKRSDALLDDGSNERTFFADLAVDAVVLREVIVGNDFDRAHVHVKWSGHKERLIKGTAPDDGKSKLFQHVYVLKRASGVKSDRDRMSSSHCLGCGAPETVSDDGICPYCGAVLNDGSTSWTLEDIDLNLAWRVPRSSLHANLEKLGTTLTDETMLACAAAAVFSDGEAHFKEEMELNRFALSRGIKPERTRMIVESVKDRGVEAALDLPPKESRVLLRLMVRICLADGQIVAAERDMLATISRRLGFSPFDIEMMMRCEQAAMYRDARARE